MDKVNLIGKRRRSTAGKNWLKIGLYVFLGGFVTYFLGTVIYVVTQISSLNTQLADVEQQTKTVSSQILSNNELLNQYVLSKFILLKIENLNKNRFRYKDYLDEIAGLMPTNSELKNVDFSVPGWVSVLISAQDLRTLRLLETSLTDVAALNRSMFSSVYSEGVSKDKTGNWNLKLQFEIRKNGGN